MTKQIIFVLEILKNKAFFKRRKINLFLIFSLAIFISLFLFYIMAVLISSGENLYVKSDGEANIYFLMNESIDELELRDRKRPKKPKQEEPSPETPQIKVQKTEIQKPNMSSSLPDLELPFHLEEGIEVGQGMNKDSEVTPIFRINPSYPRQAALRGIEGFVVLQFDITEGGETDNISILRATPPHIFNFSAIQALKKWKYKAKIENGKSVRQNNLKVQLDFKLVQD